MIIGDIEYLQRVQGFRDGAAAEDPNPAYSDTSHFGSTSYNLGYSEGKKAREDYINKVNDEIRQTTGRFNTGTTQGAD